MADQWSYKIKYGKELPHYVAYVHRTHEWCGVTVPTGFSRAFWTKKGAMRWVRKVMDHVAADVIVAQGQLTQEARRD